MNNMRHSCKDEIKSVHLRVTPARIATMKVFEKNDRPLDAQYLIEQLQEELGVDKVTVFRILNTFTQKGLLRKLEFGEGKARYELTTKEDHHHLICEVCGSIESINDNIVPTMEKEIKKEKQFLVRKHSLEFFGVCENCQKETN